MKFTESLPEAPADAIKHSNALVERIRGAIEANTDTAGGITFRRYMEMALYEPGLGYYVAGARKIGAEGDFITAPEVSPLFARCLATQCVEILTAQKKQDTQTSSANHYPDLLELGAGTGILAADLLTELERQNCLPGRYYLLDLSPDLKQRQKSTLKQRIPHLIDRIVWLERLPESFSGVILANEVLDAMPVERFTLQKEQVYQHFVIWDDETGKLVEQLRPAGKQLSEQVKQLGIAANNTPYTSELNPNLQGWMSALSQSLKQGVMLLIDYGYPRRDYYQADRKHGTLICHYQHRVNEAPLYYPGLQDITANVDFTAVAETADQAGLTVAGFTSQAAFLTLNDLEQHFQTAIDAFRNSEGATQASHQIDDRLMHRLAQQIRTLTLPSEMGERFKVIALSRGLKLALRGFSAMDQLRRL